MHARSEIDAAVAGSSGQQFSQDPPTTKIIGLRL